MRVLSTLNTSYIRLNYRHLVNLPSFIKEFYLFPTIASWRGFSFSFSFLVKMCYVLYTEQVITPWSRKNAVSLNKREGVVWVGNFSKWDNTVSTLQLNNWELCNVNIFQVFLRKRKTSIIWGPKKDSFLKIIIIIIIILIIILIIIIIIIMIIIIIIMSWDDGYLERKEPFCLYNNGPVARLFAYRSSYKEVLLHKGVLKKAANWAARKHQLRCVISIKLHCNYISKSHFSMSVLL